MAFARGGAAPIRTGQRPTVTRDFFESEAVQNRPERSQILQQSAAGLRLTGRLLDPPESLVASFEHIGVDTTPVCDIACISRNSHKPMSRAKAIQSWFRLRRIGHSIAYRDVRARPAIRPQFRRYLAEHFPPYNDALAKLLNRDLPDWS